MCDSYSNADRSNQKGRFNNFLACGIKQESYDFVHDMGYLEQNVKVKIIQEQEGWSENSMTSFVESAENAPTTAEVKIEVGDTVVVRPVKVEISACDEVNTSEDLIVNLDTSTSSKPAKPCKYVCDHCEYGTNLSRTYKNHLTIHSAQRPYICHKCGKSFKRKDAIIDHLKTHDVDKPKKYLCKKCPYATDSSSCFDRHLTTHTTERPCVCTQCGKSYKHKTSLALHMKVHNYDYDKHNLRGMHQCDQCDYKTHYRCDYKKHIMLHSDERPFVCGDCGRGFKRKHYLSEHILRLTCFKKRANKTQHLKGTAIKAELKDIDEEDSQCFGSVPNKFLEDLKHEANDKKNVMFGIEDWIGDLYNNNNEELTI